MKGDDVQRILLLEDDAELGAQISRQMRETGFEVVWWRSGRMLSGEDAATIDLVLLDLMLPGRHGLDILRALRGSGSQIPVLILSARNQTHEKVHALRLGADDYMTKPFWPDELIERVRARLRRPLFERPGVITRGDLEIDLAAHEVRRGGEPLALTRTERDLLIALAKRSGEALSRRWLVDHVLDPERDGGARTLDVHMSRLRKKLGDACVIDTVWGIGYRFQEEGER